MPPPDHAVLAKVCLMFSELLYIPAKVLSYWKNLRSHKQIKRAQNQAQNILSLSDEKKERTNVNLRTRSLLQK